MNLIFISGPYSGDAIERRLNVKRATTAGALVAARGHAPVIPHLWDSLEEPLRLRGLELSWTDWMERCFAVLSRCDGLLRLGPSPGADLELAKARELGLPVYHEVGEIPEVAG